MTHLCQDHRGRGEAVPPRAGHLVIGAAAADDRPARRSASLFAPHEPDPELGGQRFIDLLRPVDGRHHAWRRSASTRCRPGSCKYRELGVLRRLSTTPVEPGRAARRPAGRSTSSWPSAALVAAHRRRQPRVPDPVAAATRSASCARSCSGCPRCSRSGCWSRRSPRRTGGRERADLAALRGGDVPGRRLPAALAAAGVPVQHRRLHAARRPGHARRLVGHAAAAPAAGRNGGDHGRGRRGRRPTVPLGVSRLERDDAALRRSERGRATTTLGALERRRPSSGSPYIFAGRLDGLRDAATRTGHPASAWSRSRSSALTVAWVYAMFTARARAPAGAAPSDARLLRRLAGARVRC